MIRPATIITVLGLSLAMPAAGAGCRFSKSMDEVFSADALNSLQVNVLAGNLDVTGYEGTAIRFKGTVCTDQEQWLERIILNATDKDGQRRGRRARMTSPM